MKRNYFLLVGILALTLAHPYFSMAQTPVEDVVYLHDGSILRGTIKAQSSNELKIEIAGGSLFALQTSNIDSVVFDVKTSPTEYSYNHPTKGYFNITQVGVPLGSTTTFDWYSSYSKIAGGFAAQTINGYRFSPHLMAGGGVAINIVNHAMLQFFADGRYELLKRKATPYAYADVGYNIDLTADLDNGYEQTTYAGGLTWGVGTGVRFNFKHGGAFLFDVGYKLIQRKEQTTYPEGGSAILTQYSLNRLAIMIGLAF